MATHSSVLAWRIPRTEEPGRLQSMGLQKLNTIEPLSSVQCSRSVVSDSLRPHESQPLNKSNWKENTCIFVFQLSLGQDWCYFIGISSVSSVQSLSRVRLSATPWIAACQASLSITNSRSSLKLTSIESVMPSSHLILCHPLLLLPPIPPSIRVFSNEYVHTKTLCHLYHMCPSHSSDVYFKWERQSFLSILQLSVVFMSFCSFWFNVVQKEFVWSLYLAPGRKLPKPLKFPKW